MLSWLTGSKGADADEPDVGDTIFEAPETPAPVFAVRAFKHAIFGTPKPGGRQDHFDDIAERIPSKTSRSTTSGNDTTSGEQSGGIKDMPLPDILGFSPTKPNGILMTPGTTRRNKTVTFGAQVVDNEGKKPSRSGLPNTFPGKFPSPWTPKTDFDALSDTSSASTATQKRTKLTQTLHDVRDSSSKTKTQSSKVIAKSKDDMDITLDYMEPRSQSGKYWKQEYDSYAEKTQREVKRLLVKQKLAKAYARDKDEQMKALSTQLQQEKAKAEKLGARNEELERDVSALKEGRQSGNNVSPFERLKTAQDEAAKLRLENWKLREDLERAQNKASKAHTSPRKRPVSNAGADIWADVVQSSPFVVDAAEKSANQAPLATDPKKFDSPLRLRDINTLEVTQPRPDSKRQERTIDITPRRNHAKSTPRSSRDSQILPEDSIDLSLALPQMTPPEAVAKSPSQSARRTPRSARKSAAEKSIDDLLEQYSPTKSIIMSSPPPPFDRMALPMGLPASKPAKEHPNHHRKKISLAESFAKAASPVTSGGDAVSKVEQPVHETDDAKQKRSLSEEKRRAALERIQARRAGKTKG
ncbi:hypothetical protein AAFC00_003422 [Neodothiora populina]|uniref:Spindle pole body-associated protein cut12 domain-containing protein n=1 Tax=Neodothiora populina TaxID=2781224 RepID=A0ABR3PE61_9PEZI